MNKVLLSIIVISIAIVSVVVWFLSKESASDLKLQAFAKCLTEKGAVMYGAYWCPHCQNQKKLFGGAFSYVNYVECTKDPKKCEAAQVKGYPTWTFKNGQRIEGEASFAALSEKSSCPAPK